MKISLGEHVVTWKGFVAVVIPLGITVVGMDWSSARETNAKIDAINAKVESRVSREEFVQHIQAQNRWQDRMDSRMDALSAAAVQQTNDVTQAQYILVQRPLTEAELEDQRIREILNLNERGE